MKGLFCWDDEAIDKVSGSNARSQVILEKFSVGLVTRGSPVFGLDWNEDCHWEIGKIC